MTAFLSPSLSLSPTPFLLSLPHLLDLASCSAAGPILKPLFFLSALILQVLWQYGITYHDKMTTPKFSPPSQLCLLGIATELYSSHVKHNRCETQLTVFPPTPTPPRRQQLLHCSLSQPVDPEPDLSSSLHCYPGHHCHLLVKTITRHHLRTGHLPSASLSFTAEAMHFFHRRNQIMLCLRRIFQWLPTSFWVRAKLYHNLQSLTKLAWGPIPMLRVGRLPHTQAILGHKLTVLQLNSTLTLPTQRQHQLPKAEGSILQTATLINFRRQLQAQVVTCTSDQLAINPKFP